MSIVLIVALAGAVTTMIGILGFYVLCAYVVWATGSTSGLRDLAVAIRAFFSRRERTFGRRNRGGRV